MNNGEELIEEINDIIEEAGNKAVINSEVNKVQSDSIVNNQTNSNVTNQNMINNNSESVEEKLIVPPVSEYVPSKSKTPLLIILSILLVLDIAALVIYMIGIDKVLSFIK